MANPSPPSAHGAFRDSNAGPGAAASGGAGGRPPKALSIAGIDLLFLGLQVILSSVESLVRSDHVRDHKLTPPGRP